MYWYNWLDRIWSLWNCIFPTNLFRDFENITVDDDKLDPLVNKHNNEYIEIEIAKINEKLKYLTSKYDMTGNKMSKKDKVEYTRLRQELH